MRPHPVLALILLVPTAFTPGAAALAPSCFDAPLADACATAAREDDGNLTADARAEGAVPLVVAWERRANATLDADEPAIVASTNGTNPLNARPLGADAAVNRSGVQLRAWTCASYLGVVHGPCHDPTRPPQLPSTVTPPDPQPLVDGVAALVGQLVCTRPRPHVCLIPI